MKDSLAGPSLSYYLMLPPISAGRPLLLAHWLWNS